MKFIRNLIAYMFLRMAQRDLDSAKRIYAEHEGTDYGQQMGDFAMSKFRFWQACAMRLFTQSRYDVEYEARRDLSKMP